MDIENKKDRQKRKLAFVGVFMVLLAVVTFAMASTLVTAQRGVALLEEKKTAFDRVVQKHAEINFHMEKIFRDLHNLRTRSRTTSEYKQMQKIITSERMMLEEEIAGMSETQRKNYAVYSAMLEVVRETQGVLDAVNTENRKREYQMDQLEKCRQKYQEQTRLKNEKGR